MFPLGRLPVASLLPEKHPQKKLLLAYQAAYQKRFGEEPSTFGGHAFDAYTIFVQAVERVGADREKVRTAIETTQGFVGTGGVFNFSAADHNGLGLDAFEMLTVKDGRFVPLKL